VAEHEPSRWARVRRIAFAKDHVRHRLTGDAVTDRIEAEGSLLLDVSAGTWSAELCRLVPLEPRALPALRAPTELVGHVTREGAAAFGLPEGIPVAAGTSDTAAEALAAGAAEAGTGIVKLATAGNVNIVTDAPRPDRRWYTYSHVVAGLHYHSFGTNAAAASRAWLQGILGAESEAGYVRLDREAATAPPGADGLLFHPYLAGERAPVFDPTLRGSLLGLHAGHGRAHVSRAVLEGVALSLAECLAAAETAGLAAADLRLIGGGSRSRLWGQIVADALGRPLLRPRLDDASAGAALLAGVAIGMFEDARAAAVTDPVDDRIEPDAACTAVYQRMLDVYRAARAAVAPVHRELRQIAEGTSHDEEAP
jgi:xylulokinase